MVLHQLMERNFFVVLRMYAWNVGLSARFYFVQLTNDLVSSTFLLQATEPEDARITTLQNECCFLICDQISHTIKFYTSCNLATK